MNALKEYWDRFRRILKPKRLQKWARKNAITVIGIGLLFISVLLFFLTRIPGRIAEDYEANLITELFSIAITIILIDRLYAWRQREETRERLVRDLLSQVTGSAVRAVDELRHHGWLNEVLQEVKADLGGAHLEEANLLGAHLEKADLRDAHLEKADLRDAHLEEANLGLAHLEEANLLGAHLNGANLMGAHLNGADLEGAHLEKAYLWGAHLEKAYLWGAHLNGANLEVAHLEKAYLGGAHLEEANLWDAHLEKADLGGAHLEEANLWGAHFEKADLRDAHLEGANGISFEQIVTVRSLHQTTMPDGSTPEQWTLNLFGEGKITEEIFNKIIQLATGEDEEE